MCTCRLAIAIASVHDEYLEPSSGYNSWCHGSTSPYITDVIPSALTQIAELDVNKDNDCGQGVSWVFWMGLSMWLLSLVMSLGMVASISVNVKRAQRVRAAKAVSCSPGDIDA